MTITHRTTYKRRPKLAINKLMERRPLDGATIDRFLERHGAPIVEGDRATFLWRGEADQVMVRHRVVGLPDPLPLRRIHDTDLVRHHRAAGGLAGRVPVRTGLG